MAWGRPITQDRSLACLLGGACALELQDLSPQINASKSVSKLSSYCPFVSRSEA